MQRVDPAEVGMSEARLARIGEHLRERYVAPGKIPGSLTLVARGGQVCYLEQEGRRDLERDLPMTEDTIFRIYSMSKPITSVALMMLYERGLFHLRDPVHRFIPEWRELRVFKSGTWPLYETVPCQQPMCVRDLLTHMSGLTYGFIRSTTVDYGYRKMKVQVPRPGYTLKDMIAELAQLPLEFQPGTAWNYSVATDVVGYLVEVLSGKPLDVFLREEIFEPLGMVDTSFSIDAGKVDRFASCYMRNLDKSILLQDDAHNSEYQARSFFSGGGGLLSTLHDYYRFCQMLRNGGELDGVRLLGPRTLALMTANHLPNGDDLTRWARGSFSETSSEGIGFGLGFARRIDPVANATLGSVGEYHWGGMASTLFWVDPVEDLIVIFMTQLMPSGTFDFRSQLQSLIYSAIVD
ncbi:MAG: serine hydrolase domain-containing protein [Halieaceae bacterium]|jgi:CubicO group peptidase (beta-lactamase class C family)|nr:serine hydrolase domain-containing protein [Halieaceae bacterium]